MPPGYERETAAHYPILYLLHAGGDTDGSRPTRGWFPQMRAQVEKKDLAEELAGLFEYICATIVQVERPTPFLLR